MMVVRGVVMGAVVGRGDRRGESGTERAHCQRPGQNPSFSSFLRFGMAWSSAAKLRPTFGAVVSIRLRIAPWSGYGSGMKVRLLLAPLVAAVLLAAVIATPAADAATKPCSSSGLVIWAGEEAGGGTAGSVYYRVELTNLSGKACTVSGYPTVSAVDLHGKKIGAGATHEPGKKAHTVKLAPGHSAVATLRIVDALNFPKNQCKPTLAAGLRIGVPGGSGAKVAPLAFETCALAKSKTLSVSVVGAG
jgi:hypothetical protein